jgi:hypothetical protein
LVGVRLHIPPFASTAPLSPALAVLPPLLLLPPGGLFARPPLQPTVSARQAHTVRSFA